MTERRGYFLIKLQILWTVRNFFKVAGFERDIALRVCWYASLVLLNERGGILLSAWSARMGVVFWLQVPVWSRGFAPVPEGEGWFQGRWRIGTSRSQWYSGRKICRIEGGKPDHRPNLTGIGISGCCMRRKLDFECAIYEISRIACSPIQLRGIGTKEVDQIDNHRVEFWLQ